MIASLDGIVRDLSLQHVVVEVGGFGLSLAITAEQSGKLRVGERARLLTSMVVREDSMQLFGFDESESVAVFELLLKVSGVGPRSALGILAELSPAEIAVAVAQEDHKPFCTVSGIGPKIAKHICVGLLGKLDGIGIVSAQQDVAAVPASSSNRSVDEVLEALTQLGYSAKVAQGAIEAVCTTLDDEQQQDVPLMLRNALSQLGPAKWEEHRG